MASTNRPLFGDRPLLSEQERRDIERAIQKVYPDNVWYILVNVLQWKRELKAFTEDGKVDHGMDSDVVGKNFFLFKIWILTHPTIYYALDNIKVNVWPPNDSQREELNDAYDQADFALTGMNASRVYQNGYPLPPGVTVDQFVQLQTRLLKEAGPTGPAPKPQESAKDTTKVDDAHPAEFQQLARDIQSQSKASGGSEKKKQVFSPPSFQQPAPNTQSNPTGTSFTFFPPSSKSQQGTGEYDNLFGAQSPPGEDQGGNGEPTQGRYEPIRLPGPYEGKKDDEPKAKTGQNTFFSFSQGGPTQRNDLDFSGYVKQIKELEARLDQVTQKTVEVQNENATLNKQLNETNEYTKELSSKLEVITADALQWQIKCNKTAQALVEAGMKSEEAQQDLNRMERQLEAEEQKNGTWEKDAQAWEAVKQSMSDELRDMKADLQRKEETITFMKGEQAKLTTQVAELEGKLIAAQMASTGEFKDATEEEKKRAEVTQKLVEEMTKLKVEYQQQQDRVKTLENELKELSEKHNRQQEQIAQHPQALQKVQTEARERLAQEKAKWEQERKAEMKAIHEKNRGVNKTIMDDWKKTMEASQTLAAQLETKEAQIEHLKAQVLEDQAKLRRFQEAQQPQPDLDGKHTKRPSEAELDVPGEATGDTPSSTQGETKSKKSEKTQRLGFKVYIPYRSPDTVSWFIPSGYPGYWLSDPKEINRLAGLGPDSHLNRSPRDFSSRRLLALVAASLETETWLKRVQKKMKEAEARNWFCPSSIKRFLTDLGHKMRLANRSSSDANLNVLGIHFVSHSERIFFLHLLKLAILLYQYAHTNSSTVGKVALFSLNRSQVEAELKRLIGVVTVDKWKQILEGTIDFSQLSVSARPAAIQLMTYQAVSEHMDYFTRNYIQFVKPIDRYDQGDPINAELNTKHTIEAWLENIKKTQFQTSHVWEGDSFPGHREGFRLKNPETRVMNNSERSQVHKRAMGLTHAIQTQWNDKTCNEAPQVLMTHLWQWLVDWQVLRDQDTLLRLAEGGFVQTDKTFAVNLIRRIKVNQNLSKRIYPLLQRNTALHYGPILSTAKKIQQKFDWQSELFRTRMAQWRDPNTTFIDQDGDGTVDWHYDTKEPTTGEQAILNRHVNKPSLWYRPEYERPDASGGAIIFAPETLFQTQPGSSSKGSSAKILMDLEYMPYDWQKSSQDYETWQKEQSSHYNPQDYTYSELPDLQTTEASQEQFQREQKEEKYNPEKGYDLQTNPPSSRSRVRLNPQAQGQTGPLKSLLGDLMAKGRQGQAPEPEPIDTSTF
jgi:hypothetical protein